MNEDEVFTRPHPSSVIDAPGRRRSLRRVRPIGYAVSVVLVIGLAALVFWLVSAMRGDSAGGTSQPNNPTAPAALQRPVVSDAELADKVGVRIVQVAVTGGGGLIDLRYQVVDPDKAVVVHDDATPPVIVDDVSGVVADQLLMGHSHTGSFNAGQIYYLIFENPGNLVQRGSTVSVLLGDAEVDHVTVQ